MSGPDPHLSCFSIFAALLMLIGAAFAATPCVQLRTGRVSFEYAKLGAFDQDTGSPSSSIPRAAPHMSALWGPLATQQLWVLGFGSCIGGHAHEESDGAATQPVPPALPSHEEGQRTLELLHLLGATAVGALSPSTWMILAPRTAVQALRSAPGLCIVSSTTLMESSSCWDYNAPPPQAPLDAEHRVAPEFEHLLGDTLGDDGGRPRSTPRPYAGDEPHPWRRATSSSVGERASAAVFAEVHFPDLRPKDLSRLGLSAPGREWFGHGCSRGGDIVGGSEGGVNVSAPSSNDGASPSGAGERARREAAEACWARALSDERTYCPAAAAMQDWPRPLAAAAAAEQTGGRAVSGCTAAPQLLVERGSLLVSACPEALPWLLPWLAAQPGVKWVAPAAQPRLHNLVAGAIAQAGSLAYVQAAASPASHPLWKSGINGTGQVIGCGDTGVDVGNCYFYDPSAPVAFSMVGSTLVRTVLLFRPFLPLTFLLLLISPFRLTRAPNIASSPPTLPSATRWMGTDMEHM